MNIFELINEQRKLSNFQETFEESMLGVSNIIKDQIISFINSDKYKSMCFGRQYYDSQHKILTKKREYRLKGRKIENPLLANNKVVNSYFRSLTDQKVGYLFGQGGVIQGIDATLNEYLSDYIDEDELAEFLTNIGYDSSECGVSYVNLFINKKGNADFCVIDPMEIIPLYDSNNRDINAIIRFYEFQKMNGKGKWETYYKIEYHDEQYITYYMMDYKGDKIWIDREQPINPRPHFVLFNSELGTIKEESFGFVPFVKIKNNQSEQTDLDPLKSLIDMIDKIYSILGDSYEDFSENFYKLKNVDGNLEDISKGIQENNGVIVGENADCEIENNKVEYQGKLETIKQLETQIYTVSQGVNTSSDTYMSNPSGVSLKLAWQRLDNKCRILEISVKRALKQILEFVIWDINRKNGTSYSIDDITITIPKTLIVNEGEQIDNIIKAKEAGLISEQTAIEMLSFVKNPAKEMERKEQEINNRITITDTTTTDPNGGDQNVD
jgi:SPP1 family phage portal protein